MKPHYLTENLQGQTFGKLTVLEYSGKCKNNKTTWKCACECGNTKIIRSESLKSNNTTSCGCNRLSLEKGGSAFNKLYYSYKSSAKKRDFEFLLSKDEFRNITTKNCYYCNVEPKQTIINNSGNKNYNSYNGYYKYNGIDRLHNDKGYSFANCVACCKTCNRAKSDISYEEWIDYLDRLVYYRANNENQVFSNS